MGNSYNYKRPFIKEGTKVVIVHDRYTTEQEIPDSVFGVGQAAIVLSNKLLLKSNSKCPDVTVTKVKMISPITKKMCEEVYFTANLRPVS